MILEPLRLETSSELFDEHLIDFLAESHPQVVWKKKPVTKTRLRYELGRENDDTPFGEIERLPISNSNLEVKVATWKFDRTYYRDFFDSFYEFSNQKWKFTPILYLSENGFFTRQVVVITLQELFKKYKLPSEKYFYLEENPNKVMQNLKINHMIVALPDKLLEQTDNSWRLPSRKSLLADMQKKLPHPKVYKETSKPREKTPGNPGLEEEVLIDRLARAQKGEEIKVAHPEKTWGEIVVEIRWSYGGTTESKKKLLQDARDRLKRLKESDPNDLMKKIAEWREKKSI